MALEDKGGQWGRRRREGGQRLRWGRWPEAQSPRHQEWTARSMVLWDSSNSCHIQDWGRARRMEGQCWGEVVGWSFRRVRLCFRRVCTGCQGRGPGQGGGRGREGAACCTPQQARPGLAVSRASSLPWLSSYSSRSLIHPSGLKVCGRLWREMVALGICRSPADTRAVPGVYGVGG